MYEYDVFLSYRRTDPVREWVHNHFHELFVGWLQESGLETPQVFIDTDIETGSSWPAHLQRAVRRSRVMVAVFSPSYFQSRWCLAEFASMRERERLLGMRTEEHPGGLILPVRFNDGLHFPNEVASIQYSDFGQFATPNASYRQTAEFTEFVRAVQVFAELVAARASAAPEWQEDWPVQMPEPTVPRRVELPRL